MPDQEEQVLDPTYTHPFPQGGNDTERALATQFAVTVHAMEMMLKPGGAIAENEDRFNGLLTVLTTANKVMTGSSITVDEMRNMVVTAIVQYRLALDAAATAIKGDDTPSTVAQLPEVAHLAAAAGCSTTAAANITLLEYLRRNVGAVREGVIAYLMPVTFSHIFQDAAQHDPEPDNARAESEEEEE